jgi:hypothetical protein
LKNNSSSFHLIFNTINLFLVSLLIGCFGGDRGDLEYSQGEIIRIPSSIGEGLYQTKCSSCHGALESSAKIGRTFAQIKSAIQSGSIPAMNGASLQALTDEEIQAIADALDKSIPQGSSNGLKYNQIIGGRAYLASKFTEIFNSSSNSTITNKINTFKNKPGFLGGKCPHLELCSGTRGDQQQPDADAGIHPLASVTRRGFITKACQEILSVNTAVINALSKAGLASSSPGNEANMQLLFSTMNPTTVYESAASTGLITLHNQAISDHGFTNFRAWRMVIYTICISPTFEAI